MQAARRLGFPARVQAEYTARVGAVRMAIENGAISVDGLNHADESDATLLGQSRTMAVVLPGSVYQSYLSRTAPARMLVDQGAALALASGYHPPVPATYNMMTVIALSCAQMGLSTEEAITASTINAAHALLLSDQCGSLTFGKHADLIMLGVSDYREIPYQFGVNLVSMTMRKGQVVFREGLVECGAD
jgi:imidazolonepropionase